MKKKQNIYKTISLVLIVFLIILIGTFISLINGNNSNNIVREGDIVKQGEHIAAVGYSQRYKKRIVKVGEA